MSQPPNVQYPIAAATRQQQLFARIITEVVAEYATVSVGTVACLGDNIEAYHAFIHEPERWFQDLPSDCASVLQAVLEVERVEMQVVNTTLRVEVLHRPLPVRGPR